MDKALADRRGEDAKALLADPIYQEAYTAIRDRLVQILENADTDAPTRQRVNDLLVAHRKIRQYMEQVIWSGKLAAQEIEREHDRAIRFTKRST